MEYPSTRLPTRPPDADAADAFGEQGEDMGEAPSSTAAASSKVTSSTERVAVAEGDEGGSSAGDAWRATGGRSGSTTEHSARQSGQGASRLCASDGTMTCSKERR
jgi:hypothetical protein